MSERRPKKARAFFRIQKGFEGEPFGMICKRLPGKSTTRIPHVPRKINFIIAKGIARDNHDSEQEFVNYVIMRSKN